jgi:hypothetical protein
MKRTKKVIDTLKTTLTNQIKYQKDVNNWHIKSKLLLKC